MADPVYLDYNATTPLDPALAAAALRLSLGWSTTEAEVQLAAGVIGAAVQEER